MKLVFTRVILHLYHSSNSVSSLPNPNPNPFPVTGVCVIMIQSFAPSSLVLQFTTITTIQKSVDGMDIISIVHVLFNKIEINTSCVAMITVTGVAVPALGPRRHAKRHIHYQCKTILNLAN